MTIGNRFITATYVLTALVMVLTTDLGIMLLSLFVLVGLTVFAVLTNKKRE